MPIYGEMRDWLILAKEIRDQQHSTCPWVFHDDKGARLYWFYEEWQAACERAGIPRKVAVAISGHKTESIYLRYDIVAHRDLTDAAFRMEQYFGTMKESTTGTPVCTPEPNQSGEESRLCSNQRASY